MDMYILGMIFMRLLEGCFIQWIYFLEYRFLIGEGQSYVYFFYGYLVQVCFLVRLFELDGGVIDRVYILEELDFG